MSIFVNILVKSVNTRYLEILQVDYGQYGRYDQYEILSVFIFKFNSISVQKNAQTKPREVHANLPKIRGFSLKKSLLTPG